MGQLHIDKPRVKVAGGLAKGVKGIRNGSLVLRHKEISVDETENSPATEGQCVNQSLSHLSAIHPVEGASSGSRWLLDTQAAPLQQIIAKGP